MPALMSGTWMHRERAHVPFTGKIRAYIFAGR
jgi:hypothetical protein